jgi:hypothetical protein
MDDDYDRRSDDDEGRRGGGRVIADPEIWMDHYSEELVAMWHMLLDWTRDGGWPILDTCQDTGAAFNDFCHFCFLHSSGRPPVV